MTPKPVQRLSQAYTAPYNENPVKYTNFQQNIMMMMMMMMMMMTETSKLYAVITV
jgi:hypothetical protein